MRVVVVYESMYGNTHLVAEAIGRGVGDVGEVLVVPVHDATAELVAGADVLVVGGPTHVHGMSRESTRASAVEAAHKHPDDLPLDPDAEGEGLREWFERLDRLQARCAAFDTRMPGPPAFTGRASKGISKWLRHCGVDEVADPVSFLVSRQNHLEPGEEEHAERWGRELAAALVRA
jgi:hypothetical protein